ncbi:hypothetical protein AB1L42_20215 [Thalassoglobus sp. JC818]|uniref:hypothetical protein n=1 Tax=Thalassoglobus sp. JC818 TaxID=3232136 RepID=UPI0034573E22
MNYSPQNRTDDLFSLAAQHVDNEELESARTVLDSILRLEPERPDAMILLAQVHGLLDNQFAEIAMLLQTADVMPLDVDQSIRLSTLQFDNHQHQEAIATIDQALRRDPTDKCLINQYTFLLRVTRNRSAALDFLDEQIPESLDARAKLQRALIHLAEGRLQQGWSDFDQRHNLDETYNEPATLPGWKGEPLEGKHLLVTSEGGFGDQIWAARFLPHVQRLGGKISLQTPKALKNLFEELEGIDNLVDLDTPHEDFDLFCPILSLPVCLNVSDPAMYQPARLAVSRNLNPRLVDQMNRHVDKVKVGIIWSGSKTYTNNHHRSAPLKSFLPLLTVPGTRFFSLQKGPQHEDLRQLGYGHLIEVAADGDFSETAALVESMDLIIMTDTAVAHLAGSMGAPVWNLVDHSPYWYFDAEGVSEWYPSMHLFRQTKPGDWRSVFETVRHELLRFVAKQRSI